MDRQVLYANGHYFVVAVDRHGDGDRDCDGLAADGFAVVTTSGAALRYEPTFDSARDWLDRRWLEDTRIEVQSPRKVSPRRRQ